MVVHSKIKVKESDKNGVRTSKGRSTADVDHWAFLEEIEAPMWADLSLESTLIAEDNDDAWFHTSHPFHYHSACHLRSAFAHPDVGSDPFKLNLSGQHSSLLPSSVSKSRGKDYRSRDWRSNHHQVSLDKGHPINELGGRFSNYNKNALSKQCKPQVSLGNKSDTSVDDSEIRVAPNSHSASISGVSSSTITSVQWQHDSKVLGMPNDAFGQTGNLLNSLRTNLRKSCVSRPALRVEISDDKDSKGHNPSGEKSIVGSSSTIGYDTKGKESRGCNSSIDKSSVGSSSTGNDSIGKGFAVVPKADHCEQVKVETNGSIRPKYLKTSSGRANVGSLNHKFEVNKMTSHLKVDKGKRLDVRYSRKLAKPINGRGNTKKMSEAPVSARNSYCSNIEGKDPDAPTSRQEASKSKVLLQNTQKKSLNQPRVAQGVRGKVGSKQLSYSGRNFRARAVFSYKVGGKENVSAAKSKDKVTVISIGSKNKMSKGQ